MSSIFQRWYDAIHKWQPPMWMKVMLGTINDMAIAVLKKVTYAYIDHLRSLVTTAASHTDWTGEAKLSYVFSEAKKSFGTYAVTIKDSELNMLIAFLVGEFKKIRR